MRSTSTPKLSRSAGKSASEPSSAMDFDLYRPAGSHPDWTELDRRASELKRAVSQVTEFDTGSPAERLANFTRISRSLATTAGSMVKNYLRLRRGQHNLLPPYFIWTMLNRCNFRCAYCDNHTETGFFDLEEMDIVGRRDSERILEILRKNVSGIYFCGGEPTLREDLPHLAEYARKIDYFPIMINTNGSRFHRILREPRYSRLLKNLDIIIVSLDALDLEKLSAVWGVKKDLCEQVMVNILTLRKLQSNVRFKLMVNTVITPDTVSEADAILDWTNDLGIWYSPVPMNRGPRLNPELVSDPEYQRLCDKIVARKKQGYKILGSVKLIEGLVRGRKIRCFPSLVPHVDGDGHTYWPCKAATNMEPVKLNVLEYDSFESLYEEAERIISVKDIHGDGPGQCGGNCQWMQNHVSDALVQGIERPLRSGAIKDIAEFVGAV